MGHPSFQVHGRDGHATRRVARPTDGAGRVKGAAGLPKSDLQRVIAELEKQMKEAAKNLEFEKAAALRDEIFELRSVLADESNAKPWERIRLLSGEEG